MSNYKWLLDAGHGGILNGVYTTGPKKMWKFPDGLTSMEGVTNRKITAFLYKLLQSAGIDFALVYDEIIDTPLETRVALADKLFAKDKRCIYLSIHSNAGVDRDGDGNGDAKGFEIFTSKGQTKSDLIAEIFCNTYKTKYPNHQFRTDKVDGDADKEADFYVLRKTDCPSLLVENLFFDNREEAVYLLSEKGQQELANCMFEAIKKCEEAKPI
jgi:N-acetylmuramoyl-L-alanine amidase